MGYLLTILFTVGSALFDAELFHKGKGFIDHTPRFIFRAIVVGLISYFTNTNIILNAALFYLFFDYSLNIFWNKPWNYIGETAEIDKLWIAAGGWVPQLIFKLLLVIVGVTLSYSL